MNWLARGAMAAHIAVYRATQGWIGGRAWNLRMLLLTTRGRKSGLERTAPLAYFEDGGRLVLVASNGGSARDPQWWTNLQTDPQAHVEVGGERRRVRARLARPDERARLWPLVKRENPFYRRYEKTTAREIPVVLLEPEV